MTRDFVKLLAAVRKAHYISSMYRAMHGIREELGEDWDGPTVVAYCNTVHEIEQLLEKYPHYETLD